MMPCYYFPKQGDEIFSVVGFAVTQAKGYRRDLLLFTKEKDLSATYQTGCSHKLEKKVVQLMITGLRCIGWHPFYLQALGRRSKFKKLVYFAIGGVGITRSLCNRCSQDCRARR